jgi:D-methionine transport system substrate-binding protein
MKKITYLFIMIGFAIFAFTGCQSKEPANQIRVGTIEGPETTLMEVAKNVAEKQYGLHVKIVPFTDYTMPNEALNDGSIDANMFQHIPYLNADAKIRGFDLTIVGKTFIYPMAIYSKKISNINNTPNKAIVAIPNDPSNEARALLLLQKAGLITLKPNVSVMATPADIVNNPKQIVFKEVGAAQLPRVLPNVTLAVINTNFAIAAGLYPSKDGIFVEDKDSPYANVVVVKSADKDKKEFRELVDALHSEAVVSTANKLFKGQAISAW